jgi:hypothetical protein
MRCEKSGLGWARRTVGFLVLSISSCTILAAAPQGNRVIDGDAAAAGQRTPGPTPRPDLQSVDGGIPYVGPDSRLAREQLELRKLRLDKLREDAGRLAELAKALQEDIDKSNRNILSVEVTQKAKKIEKLAGRIRNESRF